jgi:DNA polymerase-1
MLNVQSALLDGKFKSRLLLQVHDELILEIVSSEADAVSALVRTQMGNAFPLKAPLDVSVGIGKSWNEAAH